MEQIGSRLRLAYYDASDGPRVMVFGPLEADFRSLQKLFQRLSRTPGDSCALHEQPFVAVFGGAKVTLVSAGPTRGRAREGIRRMGERQPVFEWRCTQESWDDLAALIDPLVTQELAGHQYLTTYPRDDAIVVVSKGEHDDAVLSACS